MKRCPEFCLWRRFRQALGPFFYANMAPETAASGRSLQQRSNPTSFARGPPFCSFWLCPAKNGPYSVRLYRTSITPIARSAHIPGAKRAAREHHVTLCERGQDAGQEAIQPEPPRSVHQPASIAEIAKQKLLLLEERNLNPRLGCIPPQARFTGIIDFAHEFHVRRQGLTPGQGPLVGRATAQNGPHCDIGLVVAEHGKRHE